MIFGVKHGVTVDRNKRVNFINSTNTLWTLVSNYLWPRLFSISFSLSFVWNFSIGIGRKMPVYLASIIKFNISKLPVNDVHAYKYGHFYIRTGAISFEVMCINPRILWWPKSGSWTKRNSIINCVKCNHAPHASWFRLWFWIMFVIFEPLKMNVCTFPAHTIRLFECHKLPLLPSKCYATSWNHKRSIF